LVLAERQWTLVSFFSVLLSVGFVRAEEGRVRLVFAGDIMGHEGQIAGAQVPEKDAYDYRHVFQFVKPILKEADFAIGNLEVTLGGPPYTGYPQFSSPDELAQALQGAGFDLLTLANNHAVDRGNPGIRRTLETLDRLSLLHTGVFTSAQDRASRYPLRLRLNGIAFAFFNATYGTNGLKTTPPCLVNSIDKKELAKDVQRARKDGADVVIVVLHWGEEYSVKPSRQQEKLAAFLHRRGVDVILGSHPHVVQPIAVTRRKTREGKKDCVTFFSHGNFVSNQRKLHTDGGIVGHVEFVKEKGIVRVENPGYTPVWVWRKAKDGNRHQFQVVPVSFFESQEDFFLLDDKEKAALRQFADDTRALLANTPEKKYLIEISSATAPVKKPCPLNDPGLGPG
jgi:poly-gamma-glutamate synthesis protein (capsule biosynthesis protein)